MRFALPALLLVLLSPFTQAQTAYTWVDENGIRHFSDTPPSGQQAETLTLKSAPVLPADEAQEEPLLPEPEALPEEGAAPEADPVPPAALALEWNNPRNDQTIRSNPGKIEIKLSANRKLQLGEQLQLLLNGEEYGAPQSRLTWSLTNVDRGTHTLSINALKDGKLIATTPAITVHLHRNRVVQKKSSQ